MSRCSPKNAHPEIAKLLHFYPWHRDTCVCSKLVVGQSRLDFLECHSYQKPFRPRHVQMNPSLSVLIESLLAVQAENIIADLVCCMFGDTSRHGDRVTSCRRIPTEFIDRRRDKVAILEVLLQ